MHRRLGSRWLLVALGGPGWLLGDLTNELARIGTVYWLGTLDGAPVGTFWDEQTLASLASLHVHICISPFFHSSTAASLLAPRRFSSREDGSSLLKAVARSSVYPVGTIQLIVLSVPTLSLLQFEQPSYHTRAKPCPRRSLALMTTSPAEYGVIVRYL